MRRILGARNRAVSGAEGHQVHCCAAHRPDALGSLRQYDGDGDGDARGGRVAAQDGQAAGFVGPVSVALQN